MDVTSAVNSRISTRAFLDKPVEDSQLRSLVERAGRSPSGGNVQPWKIYVSNGNSTDRLRHLVTQADLEETEYEIYPPKLWEPHRTARYELGEAMYAQLGIARNDKDARFARIAENFNLFNAPAAIFCFIDRRMGPPQWSDCGMYLQTFMLLAQEAGLATCAQEAWSAFPQTIADFVSAPPEEMLFCGVAIGYADPEAPVNNLRSQRLPIDQWATWV